ncbi:MAG: hypothetical protein AUK02_02900 [Anaerolineae bacterium CG2_30_58_95]|nr:MAG: hypothetical protein AUK02_02900 [Anaerolineae bacterium CG2_30_58_95]
MAHTGFLIFGRRIEPGEDERVKELLEEVEVLGTNVSDLTVDELKLLIRETVEMALAEFLTGPDRGLELRQGMKTALERSLKAVREGWRSLFC